MSLKIGIISDIHGELVSLEQALALFRQYHVHRILCAGDVVEKGKQGDAVVWRLQMQRIPSVQGNHDFAAFDNQRWLRRNLSNRDHPGPNSNLLNDETLAYLQTLPDQMRLTLTDTSIVVAHGTLRSKMVYLFAEGNNAKGIVETATDARTDIVILGHTHIPMRIKVVQPAHVTWIFNPGSVCGRHRWNPGSNTCAILSLPDCTFNVYDLATGTVRERVAEMEIRSS